MLEAFNTVRNERSLAHDNEILNHDEAVLIFSHVMALVRFIQTIEARCAAPVVPEPELDDIPF